MAPRRIGDSAEGCDDWNKELTEAQNRCGDTINPAAKRRPPSAHPKGRAADRGELSGELRLRGVHSQHTLTILLDPISMVVLGFAVTSFYFRNGSLLTNLPIKLFPRCLQLPQVLQDLAQLPLHGRLIAPELS
jgi:hypothetical protein